MNFHDQALKGYEILSKLGDMIQIQKRFHHKIGIVIHDHFEQQSLQIKVIETIASKSNTTKRKDHKKPF
jgi:hypothetical protein